MNNKLFVANLEWSITENDLINLFSKAGRVKMANVIMDRETGRSRGFGFVVMEDEMAAKKAIEEMDGTTLNNRPIQVKKAEPETKVAKPKEILTECPNCGYKLQ